MENYNKLSDERLVELIRSGDDTAFQILYKKYLPKIRTMSYPFQGFGYDIEDLIQEATIGFFTAIHVYDFTSASFSTFCYLCMRRMLIALLRHNLRKNRISANGFLDIEDLDLALSDDYNPESVVIAREDFNVLKDKISNDLSTFEREVLLRYLNGSDYTSIAEELDSTKKSVDNALQRVRRKLC